MFHEHRCQRWERAGLGCPFEELLTHRRTKEDEDPDDDRLQKDVAEQPQQAKSKAGVRLAQQITMSALESWGMQGQVPGFDVDKERLPQTAAAGGTGWYERLLTAAAIASALGLGYETLREGGSRTKGAFGHAERKLAGELSKTRSPLQSRRSGAPASTGGFTFQARTFRRGSFLRKLISSAWTGWAPGALGN